MATIHGQSKITTHNDLMVLDVEGPFNIEYVDKINIDMADAITRMNDYWGLLTILRNDSIFVPEAFNKLKMSISLRVENGLQFIAVVLN